MYEPSPYPNQSPEIPPRSNQPQPPALHSVNEAKQTKKISQNLWGSLILGITYIYFTFQLLLEIIDVASTIESSSAIGPVKGAKIAFNAIILGIVFPISIFTASFTKKILKKVKNNPPKQYFRLLSYIAFIINLITPITITIALTIFIILNFKSLLTLLKITYFNH